MIFIGCTISQYSKISSVGKAPRWVPVFENSKVMANANYKYHSTEMKLNNGMLLRTSTWNGFLKDYVLSFPENDRDPILLALTRFWVGYDKVDKIIKFKPLAYFSGPYAFHPYISLTGTLEKYKVKAFVKLRYFGNNWIFAEKVKIVADDFTWESDNLNFTRDNSSGKVWEYAYLDYNNKEIKELLLKIVNSNETIIRFIGEYYFDLTVTERMKKDIKSLINAIEIIEN